MSTFAVSDVSVASALFPAASLGEAVRARLGAPVEACGANLPVCATPGGSAYEPLPHHGFVAAVHHAFAQHYPLVLSPDDVWLCIAQGFATHVDENAEALRARFVRHEGRARIEVRRDEFVKGSPDNDWPGCFADFSDRIAEHLGKKRDLVVADFTTTGPVEKAASEVVLMSAMRRYFQYEVLTLCGIPRITLLGTAADWRSIRKRAEVLAEFDLGWWTKALLPVLDQMVTAAAGKPDQAFWRSFYKWKDGSGGPYVSGWINVLFPYLQPAGEGGIAAPPARNASLAHWAAELDVPFGGSRPECFPVGLSKAPFLWRYLHDTFPMAFVGGFVGVSQDPESRALRPAIGWAVCDAPGRA
ncbi:MAG: DUF4419 domain-containing protein [Minicystis sp.]